MIGPQIAPGPQSGPFRVRIEARQRWVAWARSFWVGLGSKRYHNVLQPKRRDGGGEMPSKSGGDEVCGARRILKQKRKPLPLRNEAQLNCVSLRSQLDCEVTCGAVKGQDERRHSAAPLTAPQVTPELGKTDKTGDAVSRPSCQSSLLNDPNAKFSVEVWRKLRQERAKKTRDGGKVDLTS